MNITDKIVDRSQLVQRLAEARAGGARIVQCDGVFELLHPGHFRHLMWARDQGDLLVVSIRPDRVIAPDSLPQDRRALNLAALAAVDLVVIDEEDWVGTLLELVRPEVYAKGAEFEGVHDGAFGEERRRVEAYGGELRFSSGDTTFSAAELPKNPVASHALADDIRAFCERHGITRPRIQELVSSFAERKVLVVGEVIVDEYVYCDPLGMSADSPTVVVRPLRSDRFVGGAGIVGQHVRSLGADCHFITVVGEDEQAEYVRSELERVGLSFELIVDRTRPTVYKKRYVAAGKKLLNINSFRDRNLSTKVERRVLAAIAAHTGDLDAVVISDFSYGGVSQAVIDALIRLRLERGVPVVGDVQSSSQIGRVTRIREATATTPSEREARLALWDRDSGVADLGVRLLEETHNASVFVTLGPRGIMVADTNGKSWDELPVGRTRKMKQQLTIDYLPSFAEIVVDSMGAGDAMLSGISCVLGAGGSLMEAAFVGSCASAVAVSNMGNSPVGRFAVETMVDRKLTW